MTFAIGTLAGLGFAMLSGERVARIGDIPAPAIALGVAGLLGYHVAYFFALETAPAIEANLVNYLWPLLIVLFSALLPAHAGGRSLKWWHVLGALSGLAGTVLALIDPTRPLALTGAWSGYGAALSAAVIWATYSVASRLFAAVPSSALVACCAATSVGALLFHLVLEETRLPTGVTGWAAVAVMGLGPVGLAFYLWDGAMKRGDLRLVGIAAYATPLLSTALLAATGQGQTGPRLWIACVLVTGGALIAALGDRAAQKN
jgi:drug/metabolite transporter (DMT)-like permease